MYRIQRRHADGTWDTAAKFEDRIDALEERDRLDRRVPDHDRGWWQYRVVDELGRIMDYGGRV